MEEDWEHFALLAGTEPIDVNEAMKEEAWREAMEDELKSIERNQTWELVDLPFNEKPISVK